MDVHLPSLIPFLTHQCGEIGHNADPSLITGWWFGTCFIFPYIGNFIIPTDELHHFSEGFKPPTRYINHISTIY